MFRSISITALALVGIAAVALGLGQIGQEGGRPKAVKVRPPKPSVAWPRNNIQHRITSQIIEIQNAYLKRADRLPGTRAKAARREVLLTVNKYLRGLLDKQGQEAFDQAVGWKASPPRGRWGDIAKTPTMVRELLNETHAQALALNNIRANGGPRVQAPVLASAQDLPGKNEKHRPGRVWREPAVFREVLSPPQLREYRGFMANLRREMERAVRP